MRRLVALALLASVAASLMGCGAGGEVSNADQAAKMKALHDAEQSERAKTGVKSE